MFRDFPGARSIAFGLAGQVALFQAALQHEPSAEMLVLLPHDVGSLFQFCCCENLSYGGFLKWRIPMYPLYGWFRRENPIKMDDLGVLLF